MATQLSRFLRSMAARPCRSSLVPFDGTISSERVAPRASSRRATRAANSGTWPLYRRSRFSVPCLRPRAADAHADGQLEPHLFVE